MVSGAAAAQAQTTITSADMFNQVGQYYMTYANSTNNGPVDVSTLLGTASSTAQLWDFTTGPQDVTNRYDYLAATNTPYGADFVAVGAKVAQQLTTEGTTNALEWLYFTEDPVKGQLDYGFYNPSFSPVQPESVYTNALQDWPISIHYLDSWLGTTVFYSSNYMALDGVLIGFGVQVTLTSTDTVDAYGLVNLPNLGFMDCLRVNELNEWDIAYNLGDGSGWGEGGTQYSLSYYWLAPGRGIAVEIDSEQYSSTPPVDMGGQALSLERMFATNHPLPGTNPPSTISGFKITLGSTAALLGWTALTGVSSYTVEYTTNLAGTITWQSLGSPTASNFMMDPAAATPGAPPRYYRVVGTVGPK
jgi:hypothetical protein